MNWHKEELLKKVAASIISGLSAILALVMIIGFLNNGTSKGVFLFVIMLLYFVLLTWANCKSLMETIEKYKKSTDNSVINELNDINPFCSEKEMRDEFNKQQQHKIYEDDEFIVTESFLANKNRKDLFLVDGILDIKVIVKKANGVIEWTSLNILYYDGNKYEFRTDRPLGISNMKEQVNRLEKVAIIISRKSKSFKKYPSYVFDN